MSNAERQRRFVERNPGYYARIKRNQRAMAKRSLEMHLEQLRAAAQAAASVVPIPVTPVYEAPTGC
jgi:hypothetical protein